MKNFQIWQNDYREESKGMLIPGNDIYKAIDLYGLSCMSINGVDVNSADTLNEKLKNYPHHIDEVSEMEEFLTEQGIEFSNIEWLPDLPVHQELLYFDTQNQQFDDLVLCDYIDAYDWWNGSNHKTETAHQSITVTKVDTEDDVHLDLDEYNHKYSGYCTGGQQWYHEVVYKVINLDGETVNDMYLLRGYSNWQESHPTGVVLSKDELDKHLEEINYKQD